MVFFEYHHELKLVLDELAHLNNVADVGHCALAPVADCSNEHKWQALHIHSMRNHLMQENVIF